VTINITDDSVCGAVDKCEQTDNIRETSEYVVNWHYIGDLTVEDLQTWPRWSNVSYSLENYWVFFQGMASLGPAASENTYLNGAKSASSEPNQMFMYLIELGRLKPNFQLGRIFMTCASDACWTFATWIYFTSLQCHEICVGLAEEQ
jgi:hypothetical protein